MNIDYTRFAKIGVGQGRGRETGVSRGGRGGKTVGFPGASPQLDLVTKYKILFLSDMSTIYLNFTKIRAGNQCNISLFPNHPLVEKSLA